MQRRLVMLLTLIGLGAGALALAPKASTNPLVTHALDQPVIIEGRVSERLRAGPYLYVKLEPRVGEPVWVASLAQLASKADDVTVTAVARADTFSSRRLARTFSPLLFGAVRATPSTPTPESK
jgi:hypothetical protein